VQVSIYSHRPEVHDAITLVPRSLERSVAGIRRLRERGVKVILANVLMRGNFQDYVGVKALAQELGAEFTIDPTITPMMDGDRSILSLGIEQDVLRQVFRDEGLVGNVDEFCVPPKGPWRKQTPWTRSPAARDIRPATSRLMISSTSGGILRS
jgi:MoaA/NifB/PqqE/SkfB family radical SAM enzyme